MIPALPTAPLAYATSSDNTEANTALILVNLAVIVAAGLLAAVRVGLARARRHRNANVVSGLALLWALVMAGSVASAVSADLAWSRELNSRIMSGYVDPRDKTDAPRDPWPLWGIMVVGYVSLTLWSSRVHSGNTGMAG